VNSACRRSGCRPLIFIDQFEELYTLCEEPLSRDAFTACLASAVDDEAASVRVVVAIRSDLLDWDEQCDAGTGNVRPSAYDLDACTTLCKFAPRCGDHVVDEAFGEQCDGSVACTERCRTQPASE